MKIAAGVDVDLMLTEGRRCWNSGGQGGRPEENARVLREAAAALADESLSVHERLAAGTSEAVRPRCAATRSASLVTPSKQYPILVERERAGRGAWYEFFPRSEGAHYDPATGIWTSGDFRRRPSGFRAVAAMGFDVIYLPPIHPIGSQPQGPEQHADHRPGGPGVALGHRLQGRRTRRHPPRSGQF